MATVRARKKRKVAVKKTAPEFGAFATPKKEPVPEPRPEPEPIAAKEVAQEQATHFVFPATGVLSSAGHHITYLKGQETFIPKNLHAAAMGVGAKPVSGVPYTPPPAPAPVKKDLSPAGINDSIKAAMKHIMQKNDHMEFTANGRPKLEVVRKILGVNIDTNQLNNVWIEIRRELRA